MKTLIWKEAREVAVIALPAIVIASVLWFATTGFDDVCLAPRKDPLVGVLLTGGCAGMLLAWLQFHGERWFGTQRLLVHRGTGRRGAFLAKALVGSSCAWAIAFVPLLLVVLAHALGENGAIVQWARVGEYAIAACDAWAAYAATAWVVNLRRGSREFFLFITAAPCLLLSVAALTAAVSTSTGAHEGLWLALNAFCALLFGSLALHAFEEQRDADLPLARRHWLAAAALGPWLYLIVAAGLVATVQRALAKAIAQRYPRVVAEVGDGTGATAHAGERVLTAQEIAGRWYALGSDGKPDPAQPLDGLQAGFVLPPKRWTTLFVPERDLERLSARANDDTSRDGEPVAPWRRWLVLNVEFAHYDSNGSAGSWERWVFLDQDAGVLRLLGMRVASHFGRDNFDQLSAAPPFERVFTRGDGRRFELPVLLRAVKGNSCIGDRADGTVWLVKPSADQVTCSRLTIPGALDTAAAIAALATEDEGRLSVNGAQLKFDGEQLVSDSSTPLLHDVSVKRADPLSIEVSVVTRARNDEQATVFERVLEPTDASQHALAALTLGAALFRPPGVLVRSFFETDEARPIAAEREWTFEPLVAGRSRPWLFTLSLLIGVASIALVVRRQQRLGHGRWVLALSIVVTALFGVWALLWFAQFEPRVLPRARPSKSREREAELLIQTV